jgi:hypothetical protein
MVTLSGRMAPLQQRNYEQARNDEYVRLPSATVWSSVTSKPQVLSPILPIAYARQISARGSCQDEHGPDDQKYETNSDTPKLRNEPNASEKSRDHRERSATKEPPRSTHTKYETNPRDIEKEQLTHPTP